MSSSDHSTADLKKSTPNCHNLPDNNSTQSSKIERGARLTRPERPERAPLEKIRKSSPRCWTHLGGTPTHQDLEGQTKHKDLEFFILRDAYMERKAEIPSSQDPVIRATCEAYMIIASCDARCSLDTYSKSRAVCQDMHQTSKFCRMSVQAVYGLCDDYHGTMSINRGHEDTRLPLQVHQYNRDSGIWDYLYDIADRDGQFHLAWLKIRAEKAQKRMKNYYDQRRQPAPHVFAGKIVWGQNPGAVPV
ncbi:hypothetical protein B0H11DRAFT_1905819 [Mycena galericulata]|nr:hypothetical protein B0H11DRAFT_1905819 [Mycena galericulata]